MYVKIRFSDKASKYLEKFNKKTEEVLKDGVRKGSNNFAEWIKRKYLSGPPGLSRQTGKLYHTTKASPLRYDKNMVSGGVTMGTIYASAFFRDTPLTIFPKKEGIKHLAIPYKSTNYRGGLFGSPLDMPNNTAAWRSKGGKSFLSGMVAGRKKTPYFTLVRSVTMPVIEDPDNMARAYRPYFRRTISQHIKKAI